MKDEYRDLNGACIAFDLDNVVEVVKGYSEVRKGWQSFVVYDIPTRAFVELRSSPPNYKGESAEEAEEVPEEYVCRTFQLQPEQVKQLRASPRNWKLVNRR